MSKLLGTNIAAPIVPFTTDDGYPTHYASYGKGGWRSVATILERDAIASARLEDGAVVYVLADSTPYVFNNGSFTILPIKGADGARGEKGTDGVDGAPGVDGVDGKTIVSDTFMVNTATNFIKMQMVILSLIINAK